MSENLHMASDLGFRTYKKGSDSALGASPLPPPQAPLPKSAVDGKCRGAAESEGEWRGSLESRDARV